ncbi:TetR/AcrR family transcriptional regulator [Nocardioides sp. TRM66260-LWL]|uniref:TetR/AcrR family transcriptional regulator n=1 Tax=Nocardioides sp. TRM66260-LWL TaxID=2874478 RepID=UPI001CC37A71|nr:TetR/AcrR family transcriptional regulator [Nocardioides sp. TRM66260-LWL]MBZ5734472.1 TetR/AcrR family transcriptional regulator [Nocardioides sp. TRM66260-LWL]
MSRPARTVRPPRASLSRDEIVRTAVAILDREGSRGLTLRGLAAELGGGLGSVYWHVAGKEELLALVCDAMIAEALARAEAGADEPPSAVVRALAGTDDARVLVPLARIRGQALALFEQTRPHPWLAHEMHVMGAGGPSALRFWDRLGAQLAAMGLTPRQQFDGSTAIIGYVTGVAAEMLAQDAHADPTRPQEEQLAEVVEGWLAAEPGSADDLPWIRTIVDVFTGHDDNEQFVAGLDLLLGGLVRQALAGS